MDDDAALDNLEKLIFIFVRMPGEFSFELRKLHVLTIQFTDYEINVGISDSIFEKREEVHMD